MLKIKRLEIEGFRGFPQAISFNLETPIVLLYGGNHQGKSSLLNGIEWCLYGDECIGAKSGIRERVGKGEIAWRIVNDKAESARVKMDIESDRGIFTINRVEVRGKGKRGKSVKVSFPDGTEKEGEDAEKEIARLLQVSFRDFATTVYQHQETIHDFVIQKPSEQSDAMDRLLGLSDYRNILDGIKKSEISKVQKEVRQKFAEFQARIYQAIKIRQREIDDKREQAQGKGLREQDLNKETLRKIAASTIEDINKFTQELGLTTSAIPPLSDWKDTQQFISNIKKECDRLWAESPDVKEQSEKLKKRSEAERLKSQYKTQHQAFKSKEKELRDFEGGNGKKEKIETKIRKTIKEIEAVDKEIRQTIPKAKLIEEGISILKTVAPIETNICPLCGKPVPNLLEHLQREWAEKIEIQVRELEIKKKKLNKKKVDFEELKMKHDRITKDIDEEKNRLQQVVDDISGFLKKELSDKDDPAAIIGIEIKKINSRLDGIENAIKSKRSRINAISETDTINLLYVILQLKAKLEEINLIKETNEYQQQEEIKFALSALVRDIEEIRKIIKSCMIKEAEHKIASAKTAIDSYFRKITENPAFQIFNIRVEKTKTGGNLYIFEDQDGKRPIPILSQGDLNSLSLSIFLGLVKATGDSHPLKFILMDDPSQSLDSQQKARLVEVINEISGIKNIVISTMDDELQNLLKENIIKAKATYRFSDWTPDLGPKISEEI